MSVLGDDAMIKRLLYRIVFAAMWQLRKQLRKQ